MIGFDPLPKISCLLVTADGRQEQFVRSYQSFLGQTYQNRELVVVNEGSVAYQEWIRNTVLDCEKVRLIFLRGSYTLGALRNISINLSHGEIFTQWDDDDFCAPNRLAIQSSFLQRSGARLCFLTDQLHFYFSTRQMYWTNWWVNHSGEKKIYGHIPGTIMAWRKGFGYRYPASGEHARAGEDSVMTHKICNQHPEDVGLLKDHGYMHVYSFHGKNVWDLEHHMNISRVRGMPRSYILPYRKQIAETIDFLRLGTVEVMGSDGLAFVHKGEA